MPDLTICPIPLETALDLRHAVLWPDMPRDFSRVPGDDDALHLGAELGERIICTASLYKTESGARLRKFATLPAFQGQGIGSRMLQAVIVEAAQSSCRLWLSARTSARPFYRRFGFSEFGSPFVKAGQDYVYMERALP